MRGATLAIVAALLLAGLAGTADARTRTRCPYTKREMAATCLSKGDAVRVSASTGVVTPRDGYLDADEIELALDAVCNMPWLRTNLCTLEHILERCDTNGDGRIQEHEIVEGEYCLYQCTIRRLVTSLLRELPADPAPIVGD